MRKPILIAVLLCPLSALAGTCNYSPAGSTVSGCPASFAAIAGITQGSTTPLAIPNTGGTFNGVTTASIDVLWGLPYVSGGYHAPSGGAQSSEDVTVLMPHECEAGGGATCQILFCQHQGGGSTGGTDQGANCFGDATIAQEPILKVQQLIGVPNRVGGTGFIIVLCNYLLTNFGLVPSGPNLFPQQWRDAKCAYWFVLAESTSIIPGNRSLVSGYGPSWGAWMIWDMFFTPDNAYTNSSCLASAPGSPPVPIAVMAWAPMTWMAPSGNNLWTNGSSHSVQAMEGQFNTTTEATAESTSAGFAPTADPSQNITSGNLSLFHKGAMLFQTGTPGLDTTVPPNWGSGATQGGSSLYGPVAAFAAIGLHPYFQTISNCVHVCDIGTANLGSPSQIDALNFIAGTGRPLGGNIGGAGLGGN
jgi:hypothetical protein